MKANKGFLAIGAKARLSQNPDVGRQRDMKNLRTTFACAAVLSLVVGALTFFAVHHMPPCLYEDGYNSSFFGADISRVTHNLTDRWSNHYRVKVHPLSALGLTIPVYAMSWVLSIPRLLAMHLFIAINASLLSGLLFLILRKTTSHILDAVLFFLLAGSSAAFWTWLPVPESFAFGSSTLLTAILLAAIPSVRGRSLSHYMVGVATMAVTITNWMAGILYSLVFLGWKRALSVSLHVLAIVTLLWGVEKYVFPSAQFFIGDREEQFYMNQQGLLRTTSQFLLSVYASADPISIYSEDMHRPVVLQGRFATMTAPRRILLGITYVTWGTLLILGFMALREADVDHGFRVMLACLVGGQYVLHLCYSNETFIYSLHWLPLLIVVCSLTSRSRFRRTGLILCSLSVVLGLCINAPFVKKTMALVKEFPTQTRTLPTTPPTVQ